MNRAVFASWIRPASPWPPARTRSRSPSSSAQAANASRPRLFSRAARSGRASDCKSMVELQLLAAGVVGQVLAGRSLDAELRALWSRVSTLTSQERPALQDMAYGTLRFLGEIDAVLERLLDKPLKDEALRQLLRV